MRVRPVCKVPQVCNWLLFFLLTEISAGILPMSVATQIMCTGIRILAPAIIDPSSSISHRVLFYSPSWLFPSFHCLQTPASSRLSCQPKLQIIDFIGSFIAHSCLFQGILSNNCLLVVDKHRAIHLCKDY